METNYQAGDAFSLTFVMEDINYIADSYPLVQLAENYYLIAQADQYIGLSYQKGAMMDNGDAANGGKPLWVESDLVNGVNEYEHDGFLYSWITRNTSGGITSTRISKTEVTISTDGVDSVVEITCPHDGRSSRIVLRGVVFSLNDFCFPEESAEEELGRYHGKIENVSGAVTLNGVEYSLFTNQFALTWYGTEENHEWNTNEDNEVWLSEAGLPASYMYGDAVVFDASGYRTVSINSDVQARIVMVLADMTFDVADGVNFAASESLSVASTGTLILSTQGSATLSSPIDGAGNVHFAHGSWELTASLLNSGQTAIDAGVVLNAKDISIAGDLVCAGSLSCENVVTQNGTLTVRTGGSLQVSGDSTLSALVVENGASLVLNGTSGLTSLTLSLGASLEISGNDFTSLATLVLTDVTSGATVELGDNDWGTTSLDEIFAHLGAAAPNVTLGGISGAEWAASHFYVNNLNTSGAGSLAYAVSQVNSYSGRLKPIIVVDAALSGSTLALSSLPTISKDCEIIGNGLTITNYGLRASAKVEMSDLTLPRLTLAGSGQVTPSNVVLTDQQAVRLESAWSGSTDFSGLEITAEGAYVGLSSLGDCTLNALPESLSGGYKTVTSDTLVGSGKTVTLADGVSIDINGYSPNIYGRLIAENTEVADAITGSGYVEISNGGTLELTNASIRSQYFRMYNAATLMMTGGVFDTGSGSLSSSYAESRISLTDVEMRDNLSTSGTLDLTDVTSTGRIEAYGSTTLDGVSCTSLYVDSDSDVSVGEGGLSLTGEEALRLTNTFTGDTARLFELGATITAENAYVGIYTLGDCTLNALPESLSGGYKAMTSDTLVGSGKTVTLADGVSIDINGYSPNIYGKLIAENTEVADAFTGSGYVEISNGGTLELTNASIRSQYFRMYNAATLEMTGGVFDTGSGSLSSSYAESRISLTGVEMRDNISTYGTLELTDVTSTGRIEAYGSTTLDGVSCTSLYVDSDSDVSVGEGGLTLTATEALRLTNTFTGDTARLFELGATITAENAYVGIYTLGDCTLNALPASLSGGYKAMTSDTLVGSGKTVTLADGVSIDTNGHNPNIYGKVIVENTEVADAFTGSGSVEVSNGGTLELTNGSIRSDRFYMYNAATLVMNGGVFDTGSGSLSSSYAESRISLTGVEVKDNISTYGTLELTDVNCSGSISAYGSTTLDGVSCTTLYMNSASDLTVGEGGLTLTGTEAIRLSNYTGNTADVLAMIESATAEDAYIGLSGTLHSSTLAAAEAVVAGEYKMVGRVTIAANHTVTLEEGVTIDHTGSNQYLYIEGTLEARNNKVSDTLISTQQWSYTYVRNGGKLLLENANVNLSGWYSYIDVENGGTLEMTGGSLETSSASNINSGGVASLVGVEVKSTISNSGTLEVRDNTFSSYLQVNGAAVVTGSG
ncbi:MAG: hypothetical protein IKW48_06510, partial [Akkermansia sp.]|nr:hypothetical protein [Akkermansia sp.]